MELAVNTLVVLILGVTLVIGGTALVYNIYDAAIKIPAEVDQATQDQLFAILLRDKDRLAVLGNVRDLEARDQVAVPVAVRNVLEEDLAGFRVVQPVRMTTDVASIVCDGAAPDARCPTATALDVTYEVPRFESRAFYVLIEAPKGAPRGDYSFTVEVERVGEPGVYARKNIIAQIR